MSLRIAVWHNLPSGGAKRALFDHVRGLVQRGHQVEAWCPPTADQTYLPLSSLVKEHVVDLHWPVPFRRLDDWQVSLAMDRKVAEMERHCQDCAGQIAAGGFDVLFANTCTFFATSPIGRFVTCPSILYLQEPYRRLYEASPELCWAAPQSVAAPSRVKALRTAFARWRELRNWRVQVREEARNARGFTKLLVNSFFSRESVLRAYGVDSEVCYLGIDGDRFRNRHDSRGGDLVGLGSVIRSKDVEFAVRAVGAVASAARPRLVWVGNTADPGYRDDMARLAASLGVDLVFRVGISDDDLVAVLNRSAAMLYAPRLEPFGLAPLEANACGVPVIAVAEGGVRETIQDGVNGLLVQHDPGAMADAITRLQDDPALARRLGEGGEQQVERHWSFTAATDRLERAIKAVCHP